MKKLVIAIIICLLLTPSVTVFADVVGPWQNSFEKQNSKNFVRSERYFTIKSQNTPLYEKPGTKTDYLYEKGELVYIAETCLYGGEYWGLAYDQNQPSGYYKMTDLLAVYDYVSFAEEFAGELYEFDGDLSKFESENKAVAWLWPGSGASTATFSGLHMDYVEITHAYKDPDGRVWCFLPFMQATPNIWLCASDPANREIPAFNAAREPQEWTPGTEHTEIKEKNTTILIIAAMVAILTAGTAVLIKIFWKKPKTAEK